MPLRLPRFERAAADIPRFQLTGRDTRLLRHVARHRFLSSRHLVQLLGGSRQPLLRRLRLLFHHGYLDRPKAQLDYFHRLGSRPLVYGLTRKAGRVLDPTAEPRRRPDNRMLKRLYLEHTLLIADVMVALEVGCRDRTDLRLVHEDELTAGGARPFRWSVTVRHDGTSRRVGVVPDRVFILECPGERIHCCLEADRGTMPVRRGSLATSSFFRKLLAYEATWTQGLHRQKFGIQRLRVLTVTTSPQRTESLREAARELAHGQGLFLFTEQDKLHDGDPLLLDWQGVREGDTSRLSSGGASRRR